MLGAPERSGPQRALRFLFPALRPEAEVDAASG